MANNHDEAGRSAFALDRRALLTAAALTAVGGRAAADSGSAGKFLWGASTAAHQIEGGNVNSDYWVLEHIPATYFKTPSGDACDSFHRWPDDIALLKRGGLNAYRFSVEWARVEPERGEISLAALDHYRRICTTLREQGVAPVVTLHHFTSPRWIAAIGGWQAPETADRYARYAGIVAAALGDVVDWVCTMNEPNAQVMSAVMANGKPWDKEALVLRQAAVAVGSERFGAYFLGDAFKARDVCIAAHIKGREAVKSAAPRVKLGMTLALQQLSAGPGGEALYRRAWDNARQPFYEAARQDDFIGIQTYNRGQTGPDGYLPKQAPEMVDDWDRDASPTALTAVAAEAHQATGLPVVVTENGINTRHDDRRIEHMRASILGLAAAREAGLPVLGYLHWSLLDNFEWSSGYDPRFGLAAVEPRTFRRIAKPSLDAYRTLIGEVRSRYAWA